MNRRQRTALLMGLGTLFLAALSGAGLHATAAVAATTMTAPAALTFTATITPDGTPYTVQAGDSLSLIARRFGVTVNAIVQANQIANPDSLRIGQKLIIPINLTPSPVPPTITPTLTLTPSPTATATQTVVEAASSPTAEGERVTQTVLSGDTLSSFAQRHGTTVKDLIRLNNIANPDLIIAGTRLIVRDGTVVIPSATPIVGQTALPAAPQNALYGRGVSLSLDGQDPSTLIQTAISLNLDWVKLDVDWRMVQPQADIYDFGALDTVVFGLSDARIKLLLTLDNSPVWARSAQLEDGPSDDFAVFARFAGTVAARYQDRVAAYQIWNEPNLRREWFSDVHKIDPASYFDLFNQAREAIKAEAPAALVITAGLASTGFNDGVNALNDRLYLQSLYDLGIAQIADGIAVHALGFANPPESKCCQANEGVLTHFENRSFYFRDTIEDYRLIAEANGDERPLWVTKFGWGSAEGSVQPSPDFIYMTYTTMLEQAQYVPAAFAVGQSLGYVGPMFLYNLNGCSIPDGRAEQCYFSLTSADGTPRAAYNALKAMPR